MTYCDFNNVTSYTVLLLCPLCAMGFRFCGFLGDKARSSISANITYMQIIHRIPHLHYNMIMRIVILDGV